MPKIYFYKMTVDDGGAPCVKDGLLSLSICKPMIRSTAAVGDILIGFAASSLHADNRIIYIAQVTNKKAMGEYYKAPYNGRPDCIYKWEGNKLGEKPRAAYHGNPGDLYHDVGHPPHTRANTLLSTKFSYFGIAGPVDYKARFTQVAAAVKALTQGHRVNHTSALLKQLEDLAIRYCTFSGACENGIPTSQPKRLVSHRGGSCYVHERSC